MVGCWLYSDSSGHQGGAACEMQDPQQHADPTATWVAPPQEGTHQQRWVGEHWWVAQQDIVYAVLVDMPCVIKLVGADPIKQALGLPWHTGNAVHCPPHLDLVI